MLVFAATLSCETWSTTNQQNLGLFTQDAELGLLWACVLFCTILHAVELCSLIP